jgi:hypothetical protein
LFYCIVRHDERAESKEGNTEEISEAFAIAARRLRIAKQRIAVGRDGVGGGD